MPRQQPNQLVVPVTTDVVPATDQLINFNQHSGMVPDALPITADAVLNDFGAQNPVSQSQSLPCCSI